MIGIKITHVISDGNIGGAGVLLSSIISGTSGAFDTEVIVPRTSQLLSRLGGLGAKITPLSIHPDKTFAPSDVATLYRYLRKNTPDALHSHASLSSRVAGRLLGISRLISTRHCALSPNEKSPLRRLLYNRLTDLTVSTADFATDALVREGVPREKIVTIRNGSEKKERLSEQERGELRRSLGIPDGAVVIGCCARLEPVKGHDLIIRAAARLTPRFDIHLLFVGGGSAMPSLLELCASLSMLRRVHFTGFVTNPHPYQSIFDINVNASRGTETSCLAISECMSLGIPSVVSDYGGNPEMIEDGVSGLIFACDDDEALSEALARMMSDRALYERLAASACGSFDKSFTKSKMVSSYLSFYLGLLG